jgi:hypothetical protein
MTFRGWGACRSACLALGVFALTGCFEEALPEENLSGTVVVPADAVEDARDIGLVYMGIYEGYDDQQLGYPYPSTGPRVGDNPIGDALPYGGTSVGAYTYACFQALRCNILTGRYASLDQLLETNPVEHADGEPVLVEELYDQCQWYYGWNSIGEFSFIGDEQLDFLPNDDGDFEADFRVVHSRLPQGSRIFAFIDNDFTSCTEDDGSINRRRSEDGLFFREGTNFADILNFPDKYITPGDLLSSDPATVVDGEREGYRVVVDHLKD